MGVDYSLGWDAVIAADFSTINKLLAYAYQQNVIPHEGSGVFTSRLGPLSIDATASASVATWTMAGGTGQNVLLHIPFRAGAATFNTVTCDLSGVTLEVQVLLRFVRSTLTGGGGGYDLKLIISDPSAIVSVKILNPPPNLSGDDLDMLRIVLTNLLQSELSGAGITLATLDISDMANQYPWLVPNQGLSYAASSNDAGEGHLGLLLATVNPPPGTPTTLSTEVVLPGCNTALILSNNLFSQFLLGPAFASAMDVQTSSLSYQGRNPVTVALSESTTVGEASITKATAAVENNQINMVLEGEKSPMPGVTVNFKITATYCPTLKGTADNPMLSFDRTLEQETHSTDVAWWVWVAAGMTAGIIGAAVVAVIQQVVNNAAGSSLGEAAPIGFVHEIQWPYAGTIDIAQVQLPMPLQLGGCVS